MKKKQTKKLKQLESQEDHVHTHGVRLCHQHEHQQAKGPKKTPDGRPEWDHEFIKEKPLTKSKKQLEEEDLEEDIKALQNSAKKDRKKSIGGAKLLKGDSLMLPSLKNNSRSINRSRASSSHSNHSR